MRIAVVITIRNEAESVSALLDALCKQVTSETEIVFVDAGSTDGTVEIVRSVAIMDSRIKLIEAPGCMRGEGRNIGIESTRADIILVTDAGCKPADDWFEQLSRPLLEDRNIDVVAGFFTGSPVTRFERAVCCATISDPRRVKPNSFLPSSRSVAFYKECWKKAGGYPNQLNFAEDTVFDLRLKHAGCRFFFNPRAIVFWRPRSTIGGTWRQFYNYGMGSALAGIGRRGFMVKCCTLLGAGGVLIRFGLSGLLALGVLSAVYLLYRARLSVPRRFGASMLDVAGVLGLIHLATFCGYAVGLVAGTPRLTSH